MVAQLHAALVPPAGEYPTRGSPWSAITVHAATTQSADAAEHPSDAVPPRADGKGDAADDHHRLGQQERGERQAAVMAIGPPKEGHRQGRDEEQTYPNPDEGEAYAESLLRCDFLNLLQAGLRPRTFGRKSVVLTLDLS